MKAEDFLLNHKRIETLHLPSLKRIVDLFFSLLMIFILLPVIVVVAILVFVFHGRPVIFSQDRPGKDGKIFRLYKFRTMNQARDISGELLPDVDRLTRFGKFLRTTSLDELPELFNILKGEMSFIGPRPLLVEYLSLYNDQQRKRHDVIPGLTGLAQVSGRNSLSWEERFELDCYYVKNWDLLLDLKILLVTVKKVITGEGVQAEDHATMPKFSGSDSTIQKRNLS